MTVLQSINRFEPCWRILLVDRHTFTRRAIAAWINDEADLQVCGMTAGATQALRAANQSRPDLVVSEILRPKDLGFICALHREHPDLPIIVFSTFLTLSRLDHHWLGSHAESIGIRAYILKEAGPERLIACIRGLLDGQARSLPKRPSRFCSSNWRLPASASLV